MNFTANYTMTIDGQAASADSFIEVINPATEAIIAHAPDASQAQLGAAVAAARRAFPAWRDTPLAIRQELVAQLADRLEQHSEDFKRLLTLEQGKPRAGADWEVDGSVYWLREVARQSLTQETIANAPEREVYTRRVPIGVVGAITPWNFPILLAVWKIAPALVAGNTMVLKPSPNTPLCTLKLGELARAILPPGVLNVIAGGNELGAWMTGHEGIGKISFTGSTATGRKIMASASGTLKRVTLELGGNDPAIVLPDVDPKSIAPKLFWTAFQNSAQFCVAAKRLYVHDSVYDAVLAELVAYAQTVTLDDGAHQGTELGPIQNRMQFEKLKDLLADTRDKGYRVALGGEPLDRPGYFIPVTIIDNPPEDSRVVVEEAFGPVLPLLRYTDLEDVIARANCTDYGLAASVWSADVAQAEHVARRLEAGTVWINEAHVFAPNIAFGGHKQSGLGVENALEGLAEYTYPQTITKRALDVSAA
jgi:acyl-CoA reductase-like NAD-dependent aldehyde dehydrogenase